MNKRLDTPSHADAVLPPWFSLFEGSSPDDFEKFDEHRKDKPPGIRGSIRRWSIRGQTYIGRGTSINGEFKARGRIVVGKYCAIGHVFTANAVNHAVNLPNQQIWLQDQLGLKIPKDVKGPIQIGHNVWIGDQVAVLSGAKIGHGAVVGANTTVTKDVEPFAIVGGSPARLIRYRFTEGVRAQFLEIAWWNWSLERMQRNLDFFSTEIPADRDFDVISLVRE